MLFFASLPSFVGAAQNQKQTDISPNAGHYTPTDNAMWDLITTIDIEGASGSVYQAGCDFDGTYFYGLDYNGPNIYQYDITGTLVGTFTISGCNSVRDLGYDGTYFYGGAAANTIYQMDFTNHQLIGTISSPVAVRGCAYDSDNDGFWVSNWDTDIVCVGRDGSTIATLSTSLTSKYGLAYDNWSPDGPYLWVFDQTDGYHQVFHQIRIADGTEVATHDCESELANAGIAGGCTVTADYQSGTLCIIGLSQASPDVLAIYDIGTTNPPPTVTVPAGPDTGVIGTTYSFTASATDPDGTPCYIRFDWGDGTVSDWIGPFASGGTATGSYAWNGLGVFNVKAQAKDSDASQSGWSDAHPIEIVSAPVLKIGTVSGTIGKIKVSIGNTGVVEATNITWWANLTGGVFLGKTTTGNIATIGPGGHAEVSTKFIIGFGKAHLSITASCADSTATLEKDLKVYLFFFVF